MGFFFVEAQHLGSDGATVPRMFAGHGPLPKRAVPPRRKTGAVEILCRGTACCARWRVGAGVRCALAQSRQGGVIPRNVLCDEESLFVERVAGKDEEKDPSSAGEKPKACPASLGMTRKVGHSS